MAGADGIHPIAVPTPFGVGPVNAYLLEGAPLTLIDGGPNLASSERTLVRAIEAHGHAVSDLELLVVTHHHVDHTGLTGVLAQRSGAPVACLDRARARVEDHAGESASEDDFAARLMGRHGVEPQVVEALRAFAERLRGFGAPAPVDRVLAPGELVTMGSREYRVHHRPGHSVTDTAFHDEAGGVLIAGDHLLSRISSNALVSRPDPLPGLPAPAHGRSRPLLAYRDSLLATRALDVSIVLGGHGPAVTEHRELIDKRLDAQGRRARQIRDVLAESGCSAHAIASRIWGRVAIAQAYLTLSEVLGHLDLLLEAGAVREDESEAVTTFAVV